MNKTKRNGFTLVELLAVIVILAVVILIAVTAVVPRMNNAKKNAFIDEALVYMKAAKEAYVTDPSIECYNVSDMGSLVKQTKSGYSGTVFVNEKGVSLNITNGKYYIKTDAEPILYDLVETKPTNFIDTCSDTNKTYTISYDLGGGSVSSANPTSYNQNTPTITLNNPTRSGYRFVGWSTKNIFCPSDSGFDGSRYDEGFLYFDKSGIDGNRANFLIIQKWKDSSLIGSVYAKYPDQISLGAKETQTFTKDDSFDRLILKLNTSKGDPRVTFGNSIVDGKQYTISFVVLEKDFSIAKATIKNLQLEEGSTATDYQECIEPTKTLKIYRGSTGNMKYIANWEAI